MAFGKFTCPKCKHSWEAYYPPELLFIEITCPKCGLIGSIKEVT